MLKRLILFALMVAVGSSGLYGIINYLPRGIPETWLAVMRHKDLLQQPGAERCGECHREILSAWKQSRHHKAWISEGYIKDSENRSKEKCLACHVPVRVEAGAKPEPRAENRDDGVFCVSCHVRDGAMNGPYDLLAFPHPTRRKDDYRQAKFCGSCHEKTFKEWSAAAIPGAPPPAACQSCHMPRREGRLTQKFPLNLLHRKREVADHRFASGEFGETVLELRAGESGGKIRVSLYNRQTPHRLPTADNGDPRLILTVTQQAENGEVLDRAREVLAPQQDTAVAFRRAAVFEYVLQPAARRTEVLLQYKPAWPGDRTEIRRQILTHAGSPAGAGAASKSETEESFNYFPE